MRLTVDDVEKDLKVRFVDTTWPNWFKKRNHLYGKICDFSTSNDEMVLVKFYKDTDYITYLHRENWRIDRFIREDRAEENTDIPRTKLEKKCRKLWNQSNWVKSNPSRAY